MKKIVLLSAITLSTLALIAFEFVPFSTRRGIIQFSLTVDLATNGTPPKKLYAITFFNRIEAEECLHDCDNVKINPREHWDNAKEIEPVDVNTIYVQIKGSNRVSPFGRTIQHTQMQYLVLIAEWPDGHRLSKLLEIPDGRTSRRIEVTFK